MKKIWTVVGTRPEIIRLGPTTKLFDKFFHHKLGQTGQNSGFWMSDGFFRDIEIREQDEYLTCTGNSSAEIIGQIFTKFWKTNSERDPGRNRFPLRHQFSTGFNDYEKTWNCHLSY